MTAHTAAIHPAPAWSGILKNPWKLGGIAGLVFFVLFVVGGLVLQGDTPMYGDSVKEIRDYFGNGDDSNRFLIGDWLTAIGFVLFFLPFMSALRQVLAPADPSDGVLARLIVPGGVLFLVLGAVGSMSWAALALGDTKDLDDSSVRLAMDLNTYMSAVIVFGVAAFLVPASLIIISSRVLWRWLGWFGLVVALVAIVSDLWLVQGDDESFLGFLGFIAFIGLGIWILATSIGMLVKKTPEAV